MTIGYRSSASCASVCGAQERCVLINSCCSRNAHMTRLYLKEVISEFPLKTQENPFYLQGVHQCPADFSLSSDFRESAWSEMPNGQGQRGVSCCLFRWRSYGVALDFEKCFQTKRGFFLGTLYTVLPVLPSPSPSPKHLETIFYFFSHPTSLTSLSNQQCLPSTDFPLALRNRASFQISPLNVLFFCPHVQLWSLFASLLENRSAEHWKYFFHLPLSNFHRCSQFTVQALEIQSSESSWSLANM